MDAACCVIVDPNEFVTFSWKRQERQQSSSASAAASAALGRRADGAGYPTPKAFLSIQNESSEHVMAFRIKTSSVIRYRVDPNCGILLPKAVVFVSLALHPKFWQDLNRSRTLAKTLRDKVHVHTACLNCHETPKLKASKDFSTDLRGVLDVKKCWIIKRPCRFDLAPPEPLEEEEIAHQEEEEEAERAEKEEMEVKPTKRDESSSENETKTPPSTPSKDGEKLLRLQQKYNRLMARTLAVTADRDAMQAELQRLQLPDTVKMRKTKHLPLAHDKADKSKTAVSEPSACKTWARNFWSKLSLKKEPKDTNILVKPK